MIASILLNSSDLSNTNIIICADCSPDGSLAVNPDHAIGVGFSDMVQFVKGGCDEIGPVFAQDTEDFGGLHPNLIVTVVQ